MNSHDERLASIANEVRNLQQIVMEFQRSEAERRAVENQLRASEEKFRKIFEQAPIGIILVDMQYAIIKANSAMAGMLGYTMEELAGRTFLDITHKDDRDKDFELAQRMFAGEIPYYQIQKRYIKSDGSDVWVNLTAAIIRDEHDKPLYRLSMVEDITRRKQAEEEFRKAMDIKSFFISMVSHELRTPLVIMQQAIELLLKDTEKDRLSEQQEYYLRMADKNINRLACLVRDVLDYQKLEAGKMEFNMKQGDINGVIREVSGDMALLAEENGLEIITDVSEGVPPVMMDRDKIMQVLVNLVNNAVKFTDMGNIRIVSCREDDVIKVSVMDTGSGIEPEFMGRIFLPFEQLKQYTGKKSGTGLGLTISRMIIEGHGGRIWIESEVGRGTGVYFTLPLK